MARHWTCEGCGTVWPRTKQKCSCGRRRHVRRPPAHQLVLEVPYEQWRAVFGDRCNICGRPVGVGRTLDRDHDHATGDARGLLCHICNRRLSLGGQVTVEWCEQTIAYLSRRRDSHETLRRLSA